MALGTKQCEMMKPILYFLLLLFSTTATAQYDSQGDKEISRFRPGVFWFFTGTRPTKTEKIRKYDRLIFDITYNDWAGDLKPFQGKSTSVGFGANLLFDVPFKKDNTVSMGWGLNYHRTHVQHNNSFFTNLNDNWTQYAISPVDGKGSLNYNQFSIPLEIRFRKESWKHSKIHLGAKIGYITNMNQKNILKDQSGRTVIKDYHFPDINNLQYSAHLRFGLRNYAFFGEYNFAKLFSNPASTRLNIFRFGISISLF
jgi:hypothetical protein